MKDLATQRFAINGSQISFDTRQCLVVVHALLNIVIKIISLPSRRAVGFNGIAQPCNGSILLCVTKEGLQKDAGVEDIGTRNINVSILGSGGGIINGGSGRKTVAFVVVEFTRKGNSTMGC